MSHHHACDYAGQYWYCENTALRPLRGDIERSVCICLKHRVPMEQGDHRQCSVELLACPEHRDVQLQELKEGTKASEGFGALLRPMNSAEPLKFDEDYRFMGEVASARFDNLDFGFDAPRFFHFSPADFAVVIDRCEWLQVRIIGIEIFATDAEPPWRATLLEVEISPEESSLEEGFESARCLVQSYLGIADVTVGANFDVLECARPCPPGSHR